jgi:hypothetical protein
MHKPARLRHIRPEVVTEGLAAVALETESVADSTFPFHIDARELELIEAGGAVGVLQVEQTAPDEWRIQLSMTRIVATRRGS